VRDNYIMNTNPILIRAVCLDILHKQATPKRHFDFLDDSGSDPPEF